MAEPHRIELREPWTRQMAGGVTELTRHFNSPTGIGEAESVWLILSHPTHEMFAELNGQRLGETAAHAEGAFEITALLASHNELRLTSTPEVPDERPSFEGVRLEIRTRS